MYENKNGLFDGNSNYQMSLGYPKYPGNVREIIFSKLL